MSHGSLHAYMMEKGGARTGLVCFLCMQVNSKGQICGATMEGAAGVGTSMLQALMAQAQKLGPQLLSAISGFVSANQ